MHIHKTNDLTEFNVIEKKICSYYNKIYNKIYNIKSIIKFIIKSIQMYNKIVIWYNKMFVILETAV